jgi:hypothetical protein
MSCIGVSMKEKYMKNDFVGKGIDYETSGICLGSTDRVRRNVWGRTTHRRDERCERGDWGC